MTRQALPQAVRDLVHHCIDSISVLETLLLMQRTAASAWDADAIAAELRIARPAALEQLIALVACGLLVRSDEPSVRFRYQPSTPELASAVEELRAVYATHSVSVVELIYSKATDKIRVFAEAFRLRKDE